MKVGIFKNLEDSGRFLFSQYKQLFILTLKWMTLAVVGSSVFLTVFALNANLENHTFIDSFIAGSKVLLAEPNFDFESQH